MFQKLLPTILFSSLVFSGLFSQQIVLASIMHNGIERDYRLYVPSGYSSDTPAPLVFNLHGYTSNAEEQEAYSEMNVVAEANDFLVCYPNGINNAWNVEWNFGSTADDVGFISTLIDELADNYSINLSRVYSCGMSNGGFMSYRLACELNNKIAAIASVTGSMVPGYTCTPDKSVPVLEIHGTADLVVPYNGMLGLATDIDDVIDFWVTNNGCENDPIVAEIENTSIADLCTATRYDYNECDNSRVSLIKINGGGHTWPGASISIGVTNQDFNASEIIWDFFSQFDLNGPTNISEELMPNKITIYPNPASDLLKINTRELFSNGEFEIFNNFSQKIRSGKLNGNNIDINIENLNPGIYYLTLKNNKISTSEIFIKN